MAFLGFFNVYALRVNLSVAIVAMTENRTIELPNGEFAYEQYFNWTSLQKGLVLSSFFYGYITTQFIGGYVSSKIGGNLVFGVGIGMTALLTLVTPIAAKTNVYLLIAVRIIEGVFEGVTFPCVRNHKQRSCSQNSADGFFLLFRFTLFGVNGHHRLKDLGWLQSLSLETMQGLSSQCRSLEFSLTLSAGRVSSTFSVPLESFGLSRG